MLVFRISFSCFLILCVVGSVVSGDVKNCDERDKDMKNVTINTSQYCKNNICIYKCCGENKIFNHNRKCDSVTRFTKLNRKFEYENIPITQSLNGTQVTKSNKRLTKDFVFIYNNKFFCKKFFESNTFHIWENGTATLSTFTEGLEGTTNLETQNYCVDYRVILSIKNHIIVGRNVSFVLRTIGNYQENFATYFFSIGMLVSCFFLFLVLLVYGLLPPLHNIGGMVLMAYVSSLFLTYLLRAVLPFVIQYLDSSDCRKFSPVLYFAALSKFFWLNIMAFDLFWTFRGTRKCRAIHRQGELVKFMWYCLYAWGVPLLITITVFNLDTRKNIQLEKLVSDCFNTDEGVFYYLHIPISIIIVVNTLLFFVTVYNIWLIKREIRVSSESRNTKKDISNLILHLKLAVLMGISWTIEILPNIIKSKLFDNIWLSIVVNFYHVFIGVVIFFLFVFKKKIFFMLCKRFHINNVLGRNLQASYQYSKSDSELKNLRRYTFKSSRNEGP